MHREGATAQPLSNSSIYQGRRSSRTHSGAPKLIVQQKNQEEEENYARARRVSFQVKDSRPEAEAIRQALQSGSKTEIPDYLSDLYKRAITGQNVAEKGRVPNLLIRFQDSFSRDEWELGLTNLGEHAIPIGDSAPIKQPPRRVPLAHAEVEKQAIEDLRAKGVIRDSVSLVAKKDGGILPCVD